MGELIISKMFLEDIDCIMEIEVLCFSIPWSREAFQSEITTNNLAEYIVARLDGKIVGYAGMWKILDEGHITNIAVHPDVQRQKIGTRMVEELIQLAKQYNIEKLTLEVRESNTLAQGLYKNFGFEVLGIRKKYYEDNKEDALIMWMVM